MIYANKLKNGDISVSFKTRDGEPMTYAQFEEEMTAIYLSFLEHAEDIEIAVKVLNGALLRARETFLERRNNYFDGVKGRNKA